VAQAGITLYRVGAVKPVRDAHVHGRRRGDERQPAPVLYGSGYEAFDVDHPLAKRPQPFDWWASTAKAATCSSTRPGFPAQTGVHSVIATPVTGAYGYSMASNYNRVPRPAVVFVANDTAREVLRRETFDDLARLEVEGGAETIAVSLVHEHAGRPSRRHRGGQRRERPRRTAERPFAHVALVDAAMATLEIVGVAVTGSQEADRAFRPNC
jgi:hypothetical protein